MTEPIEVGSIFESEPEPSEPQPTGDTSDDDWEE
jgi:hypothetical protein